jgi:branched-chain amino acid transport system ATP-binding protein
VGLLLKRLSRERRTAFVVVEHVMGSLVPIIDRVVVMETGALLAEGRPNEVLRMPSVLEAYFAGFEEEASAASL